MRQRLRVRNGATLTVLLQTALQRVHAPSGAAQTIGRAVDGRVHLLEQLAVQLELVAHLDAQLALPRDAEAQRVELPILRRHLALLRLVERRARRGADVWRRRRGLVAVWLVAVRRPLEGIRRRQRRLVI